MVYTPRIQAAIRFAIKTHEVYRKQKRKGKDIAYITHPLTVALILSQARASEDVVIAGILHDTVEDSIKDKKVDTKMLEERFGAVVANLVDSVTEHTKSDDWVKRKQEAIERITSFSHDSVLVKSADVMSNVREIIEDHKRKGDEVFARFNAPEPKKNNVIKNQLRVLQAILTQWPDSPLTEDLKDLMTQLQAIGVFSLMIEHPAGKIEYADYKEDILLQCPVCGWQGTPKDGGVVEYYDALLDVSCPDCDKMLLIVSYPMVKEIIKPSDPQKTPQEFAKRFGTMDDEMLIGFFNKEVGNTGWTSSRAAYLSALHEEFEKRGFDYSKIGNKTNLSFKNKIKLINHKIEAVKEEDDRDRQLARTLNRAKPKILFFEDDRLLRNMYETKFGLEEFLVAGYDSPTKDPVNLILKEKPDIIISGVVMPGMDGFAAARIYKADSRTKDIPLIFLTNLGMEENVKEGNALGAVYYMVKAHFMPSEVVDRVRQVLGLPSSPEKQIPSPKDAWHGQSVADLPSDKPKSWWRKLFG